MSGGRANDDGCGASESATAAHPGPTTTAAAGEESATAAAPEQAPTTTAAAAGEESATSTAPTTAPTTTVPGPIPETGASGLPGQLLVALLAVSSGLVLIMLGVDAKASADIRERRLRSRVHRFGAPAHRWTARSGTGQRLRRRREWTRSQCSSDARRL